jgi:diketogulonate reductase-like aldo/keto reductase
MMDESKMTLSNTNTEKYLTLYNGYKMPLLGLGTFLSEGCEQTVYEAIKAGLRLIDTAARYLNEKQVGQGISQAISEGLVKRELFVVTKLWVGDKEDPERAIKKSLSELNLDYVDLYLDHWPMQIFEWEGKSYSIPTHVVWKKMEDLVRQGYTKSIGISNYNVQRIMDLLAYAEIRPAVLQVELNPYLIQKNLLHFCRSENIAVMAYNSLCKNKYVDRFHKEQNLNLLEEDLIKKMATKYGKTAGQIAINWAISQGLIAIPGSSNPKRILENIETLNFRLTKEDIDTLASLNRDARCNESTQWDFFKKIDLFA